VSPAIAFLHTAPSHQATFSALVGDISPGVGTVHVVDQSLLVDARARGAVDDELRTRVAARIGDAARDADVVVCTCSTIAAAAEALAGTMAVPMVRIDRPMAQRAVAAGPRLAVVAALPSTIGPTTDLLREVAHSRGVELELTTRVCAHAWEHFERGDVKRYLGAVATTVDALGGPLDAVVLAQASMAGAADRCRAKVPVLSSPRPAVEAALGVLTAGRQ
jgi:aspartate/glutamate racemase